MSTVDTKERPLISPCDCKHGRTEFIQSTRSSPPPYREYVYVCRDCGQFTVVATRNGEHIRVEFTLSTPEGIEAAGRYLKYLEADEVSRTLRSAFLETREQADRERAGERLEPGLTDFRCNSSNPTTEL
jgi:hypothetical protein